MSLRRRRAKAAEKPKATVDMTSLIDLTLVTEAEIAWINAYHERVYKETAPLLNSDEAAYLARKCAPIGR